MRLSYPLPLVACPGVAASLWFSRAARALPRARRDLLALRVRVRQPVVCSSNCLHRDWHSSFEDNQRLLLRDWRSLCA